LKNLQALRIQARKDNKARLACLREVNARNRFPAIEDIILIHEPDKNPTPAKKLLIIDERWEDLVQVIKELK
jgi:hypothetical protein